MINNHVTSLELSKRLKELGVPQKSEFYWKKYYGGFVVNNIYRKNDLECYSAYLASELGEIMPFSFQFDGKPTSWESYKKETQGWEAWLEQEGNSCFKKVEAITEADARALLLIRLLENSLIKPEDLGD